MNLPARLAVADEQVVIEVEDRAAEYPLTIDPLFTLQQKLLAADGAAGDYLGYAVALDGDTALVGAPYDDQNGMEQGSAYVFVRQGGTWTQQARLVAQDRSSFDYFGYSVALDGNTALVGAVYGPGSVSPEQGAVYVFVRGGTTWTQQARLNAGDGQSQDQFGAAVALDGDTALIGAFNHQTGATSGKTGAAYVFTRSGGAWTEQARLKANDGEGGDQFGFSVALEGDTALIGAPNNAITVGGQGAAYIFTRSGASWTQQQRLIAVNAGADDHFGNAVALSGEKALIGAYLAESDDSGMVYDFRRGPTGWAQTSRFRAHNLAVGAHFGVSVALDGDTAVIGASLGLFQTGPNAVDQRSAYVFLQLGEWVQVRQFGPELGSANDSFGYAVALDGDTVLVGAYRGDAAGADQGAAYAFALRDSRSVERQRLIAQDGAEFDHFGGAVAISGDTLVVGAGGDDIGMNADQGSAYVFTRSGASQPVWTFQQKLVAANTDGLANDNFGASVAVDADTVAVGATGVNGGRGAVYVFTRNGAVWTQQQKLAANDGAVFDTFGFSVALDGGTLVAGAPLAVINANANQGAAYVFTRNGAVWTQQRKLTANDGAMDDRFGFAVALDNDTVAVGAPEDTIGSNAKQGSVYVFTRNGTVWTQQPKLTASDGAAGDFFGGAVAIEADTLVVGAEGDTIGANAGQGSAYVYTPSGTTWQFRQKLIASDGAAENNFGRVVAVSDGMLVVGAPGAAIGGNRQQGSAYVYSRLVDWYPQQKLIASDGADQDRFGCTVALSADTVVVGALNVKIGANDNQGSAYVFVSPSCPAITLAPNSLPNGALGVAYNQPLTESGGGVGEYILSVSRGALPPGLKLSYVPGLLSGTPTAAGTYRFTITATFLLSGCSGSRDYTITVTPSCPPLTVGPETLSDGAVGAAYLKPLSATGGSGLYSFKLSAGALPAGLVVGDGAIVGTPTQAGLFNFTVRATDANGCQGARAYTLRINAAPLAIVSAASYKAGGALAPDSIVAAFGANLAAETRVAASLPLPTELAGATVTIRDSQGATIKAPLFFVSPNQINYLMPAGLANGMATITVTNGNSVAGESLTEISAVAPGLFSANASGAGAAAAVALRIRANGQQVYEPVSRYDAQTQKFVPAPIDLSNAAEQVYLILFGTGFRHRGALQDVMIEVGGTQLPVAYAGAAPGVGLDQVNVLLPASLSGRGEQTITLRTPGKTSNGVNARFQ
ncbi:MAG: hypothetical protein JMDDDDMK_03244 [Acidobacteria bacterium]|nr:hypothetical protein [Acidobacteriota bacterium]